MARELTLTQGLTSTMELIRGDFKLNHRLSERISVVVLRSSLQLYRTSGPVAWVLRRVAQVAHNVWLVGVMGADIPSMVKIGPRLRLPHAGRGVVLHCTVSIGADATVYHRVTVGARGGYRAAQIGNNVYMGVGCAILGDVTIGDGTNIGAQAVVLTDTEPDSTYVGQAARAVARRVDPTRLSREPAPREDPCGRTGVRATRDSDSLVSS